MLFLTRSVGLDAQRVGWGLLIAGAVGMLTATPAGVLADRVGHKWVFAGVFSLRAIGLGLFVTTSGFWTFLVAATVYAAGFGPSIGLRISVATAVSGARDAVHTLAQARIVGNLGIGTGGLLGAVVVQADSRVAYVAMLVSGLVACACTTVLLTRLRTNPVTPVPHRPSVLRDRPFLRVAGLLGMVGLSWTILSVAVPLWVAGHPSAPLWTIGAMVATRPVTIILLQVRASASAGTPDTAGRTGRRGGLAIATACLLFAATAGTGGALGIGLLLLAGGLYLVGEILLLASSWGLAVGLAPPAAQGSYQGVVATGTQATLTLGPLVMTTLVAGWGAPGWWVLAALFALAGLALVPAARQAVQSRAYG